MTSFRYSLAEYSRRLLNGEHDISTHYDLECVRLFSFRNCTNEENNHYSIQLAANGFYYKQSCLATECFFCGVVFPKNLSKDTNIADFHRNSSPCCQIVLSGENSVDRNLSLLLTESRVHSNNQIISIEHEATSIKERVDRLQNNLMQSIDSGFTSRALLQEERPNLDQTSLEIPNANRIDYNSFSTRLSTFTNWISSQSPVEMAQAGFIFTGKADCVKCFSCHLCLRNWEPSENPWLEHQRRSSDCPFLKSCMASNELSVRPTEQKLYVQEETRQAVIDETKAVGIGASFEDIDEMGVYGQTEVIHDGNVSAYLESPAARANIETAENKVIETELVKETLETLLLGGDATPTARMIGSLVLKLKEYRGEISRIGNNLLQERKMAKEEIRKAKENRLCRICLVNDRGMVILPCGHLVCAECSTIIGRQPNSTCPYCRKKINGTTKVFMN